MQPYRTPTISAHLTLVRRLASTVFVVIAAALAFVIFGGVRPAAAQAEKPTGAILALDVPEHVVDELGAVVRGTPTTGVDVPQPQLNLAYKLCGTDSCLCIDVEPDQCIPERSQQRYYWITLAASTRTSAVLDLATRELQSGKYVVVKVCSTYQTLHDGCLIVSPD